MLWLFNRNEKWVDVCDMSTGPTRSGSGSPLEESCGCFWVMLPKYVSVDDLAGHDSASVKSYDFTDVPLDDASQIHHGACHLEMSCEMIRNDAFPPTQPDCIKHTRPIGGLCVTDIPCYPFLALSRQDTQQGPRL